MNNKLLVVLRAVTNTKVLNNASYLNGKKNNDSTEIFIKSIRRKTIKNTK